jgi:hypothetical protein
MAKANLSKLREKLKEIVSELEKPQNMRDIGEYAVDRIVKRTRLGRGVSETGQSQALKPLSKSYKDQRAGRIAFFTTPEGVKVPYKPNKPPKLSGNTTPGKSNLTFTDQMLNSIKVVSATTGKVNIAPTGNRKSSDLTNKEVADFVSVERRFLDLSKAELAGLQRYIADKVLKKFR